jgi:outer membrane protein assembly factor BamB
LWWVRGLTWQAKPGAVVSDDTIYATGWAPGADAGERQALPPFEEVLKEADKNGDGKISAEELPAKWKHSGSWAAIDLDHDNLLDARDWSFYRARRSSENVTMAVRPANARGDLTDTHVIWKYDRAVPQVSSPLLYEGILYTIKDGGVFTSFDPRTGNVQKQARLPKAIDSYYASPVAADKKVIVVSETGKISILKAGREWESLAVNDMEEPCYATPAIAGNCIYLRTATTLYCFRK